MADRDIAYILWQEELCHEMVWPIAEIGGGVCGVCVYVCTYVFVYMCVVVMCTQVQCTVCITLHSILHTKR